ncbi:hypothetical protein IQ07DRAFT_651104 [Pyrenochaeta sp. DS3sAY3a]|nr:hypothetical protein IQ07DRAFT_651104 [Pyrenochaeta sp. DS3sAY3a]
MSPPPPPPPWLQKHSSGNRLPKQHARRRRTGASSSRAGYLPCTFCPPSLVAIQTAIIAAHGSLRRGNTRRGRDHQVTTAPTQTGDIHPQISRLGRFCGFEQRLTGYCLRRGVAYILALKTSEHHRQFLMGHNDPKMYFPYMSKISTIDFAALFRNLESRSVIPQTGISLNRSASAPLRISEAGMQTVLESEDVQVARQETEAIRNAIMMTHGSLTAARRCEDPRLPEYEQSMIFLKSTINAGTRRIYRQEYKEHFDGLQLEHSTTPGEADGDEAAQIPQPDATGETNSLLTPASTKLGDTENNPTFDEETLDEVYELMGHDLEDNAEMQLPVDAELDSTQKTKG